MSTIRALAWIAGRMKLADFLRRPRCHLYGCQVDHPCAAHCCRCGAHLYEEFIQASLCDPLQRRWYGFTERVKPRRCEACGKWIGWKFSRQIWPPFCSECEDGWIPF